MTAIYWLGAHKTGTTYLQKSLDLSTDALVAQGVQYLELEEFRDRYTRPLFGNRNAAELASSVFDGTARVSLVFDENIPGVVQDALPGGGFYPHAESNLRAMSHHLDLPVDDIILGVRSYDTYLPSLYCEILKARPFRTFDEFLQTALPDSAGVEQLDWYALARRLAAAHPSSRVRVYFQEDLRGHEPDLLADVLGMQPDQFTMLDRAERPGFSARAVDELHRIHAHRRVEVADVKAVVRQFPRSGPDQQPFDPWQSQQRLDLQTAYRRHRAWLLSDERFEVIGLPGSFDDVGARDGEGAPAIEQETDVVSRHDHAASLQGRSAATTVPDLSVVIPVHDAAPTVVDLTERLLAVHDVRVQVVLVDDASTDGSAHLVDRLANTDDVVAFHHSRNMGAGVARNTGFRAAVGRHCLFFDADDIVHVDALGLAIRELDETGADLAMLAYDYRRGGQPGRTGMNAFDEQTWDRYVRPSPRQFGTLEQFPRLLECSNYPWNKILRTQTYRRAGIRFGSTPVHNDILGHWYSLLFARSIVVLDAELCTHVVEADGGNLTNDTSASRVTLIDALDETYDLLEAHPELRRQYARHYWALVMRVSRWASQRVEGPDRLVFDARLRAHLRRIDLADFARIRLTQDPSLAGDIVATAML